NGQYDVVLTLGDATVVRDNVSVTVEGQSLVTGLKTNAGQYLEARGRVSVSDGQLTVRLTDGGGVNGQFAVAGLTATPVDPNASSLWTNSSQPSQTAKYDRSAIELGVRFQPLVDGFISGVRFYKAAGNNGTHIGDLWSATGQRLATATFQNETGSGWQQVIFSSPVAVKANTTYVVSYYAPRGNYSYPYDYFSPSGLSSGQLRAMSSIQGGGGVYRYGGSGFPSQSFRATNYWVDVVFQPGATTPPPTADAGPNQTTTEGSTVQFSGAATGTDLPYTWDFGDGTTASGTLNPTHVYADNGTYTATLTVTDGSGGTATGTAVITVQNVSPTATFHDNNPIPEGSPVTVSFANQADPSSTDQAAGFTYSYDFDNDGVWDIVNSPNPSAQYTFNDNGVFIVRGRISDKDGGFTDYTTDVEVTNVAPTATFANGGPVTVGSPTTFSFTNPTDPSTVDVAAGVTDRLDFDNTGTWDVPTPASPTASFTSPAAGTYTAVGRIADKDGGFTDYTITVIVNPPAPPPPPTAPTANAGPALSGNEGSP